MAVTAEMDCLIDIMRNSYERLRGALEPIPEDQLNFAPEGCGFNVRQQVMHSCGADINYYNMIDGAGRPSPRERVGDSPDKDALKKLIDDTEAEIIGTMQQMPLETVHGKVEVRWFGGPRPAFFVMLHVMRHIHYHAAQLTTYQYCLGVSEWKPE